ncbi:PREDICTED: cyclin-dependent kinase inhibitor 7-like isoform X2 [Ipomoea nil]|uniref:cyclin-dependent kinase inhibitor 7-like isoform X2 n=1 Tax=Ipomoea nil TaxID=35883 RepID=UPI000900D470|nr:PREDICTED: cyclin-dependent kinase inhibitor 7-like isoform X2 [Ipomoea nil]
MKEYLRRPEGMGETGGNRAGLKSRAPEVSLCCSSSKRRKVSSQCGNDGARDEVASSDNSVSPAVVCEAVTSKCSSCESSESVKEDLRNIDLKAKDYEEFVADNSGSMNNGMSETPPSSELCGDSIAEMESSSSTAKKKSPEADSRRKPADAAKTPSAAEIEEFFSATEKYVQKRFAEKYNYDIVKDVPLEGRYQWVRLKP